MIIEKAIQFQENIYCCFVDYTKPLTVWMTTNFKVLKEIGIPDHLTCHLRNCVQVKKPTVRTEHGTTDQFNIGKGASQGCMSPYLFNRWYHSNGRKWRGPEEPIHEGETGEWKNWLKTQHENRNHGIWSHHLMANRWGNNGNSDRLFSWAPKSLQLVAEAMKLKMLAP